MWYKRAGASRLAPAMEIVAMDRSAIIWDSALIQPQAAMLILTALQANYVTLSREYVLMNLRNVELYRRVKKMFGIVQKEITAWGTPIGAGLHAPLIRTAGFTLIRFVSLDQLPADVFPKNVLKMRTARTDSEFRYVLGLMEQEYAANS